MTGPGVDPLLTGETRDVIALALGIDPAEVTNMVVLTAKNDGTDVCHTLCCKKHLADNLRFVAAEIDQLTEQPERR